MFMFNVHLALCKFMFNVHLGVHPGLLFILGCADWHSLQHAAGADARGPNTHMDLSKVLASSNGTAIFVSAPLPLFEPLPPVITQSPGGAFFVRQRI
jgi:hypothetical protein